MRLPERFRDESATDALDPEVEAQLAVIDEALAGGPAPAGDEALAQLTRELRAERAEPDPGFAAELDRWAAGGFERAERPGGAPETTAERLRGRLPGLTPRRLLAPAGALATLVIVAGIAVSQSGVQTDGGDALAPTVLPADDAPGTPPVDGGADTTGTGSGLGGEAAQQSGTPEIVPEPPGRAADSVPPDERKVARAADLVLAAEPSEVRGVADGVNAVVNRYRGIVVSSSVQSGDVGGAGLGSQFRLRLPARNLQAALADLSELAHVRSRTESTEDITGRFITAQERIEELRASREGLLERLADAGTEDEADAIRAELRKVNSRLSAARSDLTNARDRVRFVPVTVSIVVEEGAGDDGQWGVEEALDDAGRVLSAAAGILIVAGAVLLPLALVGVIVALALRLRSSRGRERALDE